MDALKAIVLASCLLSISACNKDKSTTTSDDPAPKPDESSISEIEEAGPAPEATLPYTDCLTVKPTTIGGIPFNVYCTDSAKQKPFITPYLKIDWVTAGQSIEKACPNATDKDIRRIEFPIEFMRPDVISEIENDLANKGLYETSTPAVYMHPYFGISLGTVDDNSKFTEIYSYPKGWRAGWSSKSSLLRTFPVVVPPLLIKGTCDELREIVLTKNIQGKIYFTPVAIAANSLQATIREFAQSSVYGNIVRDQKGTGSITVDSSGRSRGGGINLGFASFGGGSSRSSSSTTDTRRRYTSEDVLVDAAQRYAKSASASITTQYENGAVNSKMLSDVLTDFILNQSPEVELKIEKESDRVWKVFEGSNSVTLNVDQAEMLLDSNPGTFESKSKVTGKFTYAAISGEHGDEKEIKIGLGPVIKWQKTGQSWIPHSVKLRLTSAITAERINSFAVSEAKQRYGMGLAYRFIPDVAYDVDQNPSVFRKDAVALTPQQFNQLYPNFPVPAGAPKPPVGQPLCSLPLYTVTKRDIPRMGRLLPPIPNFVQVDGGRFVHALSFPGPKECTGSEQPDCAYRYTICVTQDRTRGCAVRHLWMKVNAESIGMNIESICAAN